MKRYWVVPYGSQFFWTVWDSRESKRVPPPGFDDHLWNKRRAKAYARTLNRIERRGARGTGS